MKLRYLCLKNVFVQGNAYIVGNNHLKLSVFQNGSPVFECIGFGLAEHVDYINSKKPFNICFSLEENSWRGKKNLQLNIKSIQY